MGLSMTFGVLRASPSKNSPFPSDDRYHTPIPAQTPVLTALPMSLAIIILPDPP